MALIEPGFNAGLPIFPVLIDAPHRVCYSNPMPQAPLGFFKRLREDTTRGLQSLRQSAMFWTDRALMETELLRLRYRLSDLDRQLAGYYREVGEKVYGRLRSGEEKVLSDDEVSLLFPRIDRIRKERDQIAAEIEELKGKGTESEEPGG